MHFKSFTQFFIVGISLLVASDLAASQAPRKYVEKLTGPLAKHHLENISAKRGGVFGKAAGILSKRGWKDTGRIVVQRTNLQIGSKSVPLNPSYRFLQSGGGSSADGEMITWEWDDGDYDTWEGTIYLHEYDSGTWMAVDCQFWLTDGNAWQEVWSSVIDGEDAPNYGGPRNNTRHRFERRTKPVLVAALGELSTSAGDIYLVDINWERIRQKFRDWGYCTAFGCAGGVAACNLQNPTPQEKPDVAICSAAWCIAAGIGCLNSLR